MMSGGFEVTLGAGLRKLKAAEFFVVVSTI